MASLKDLAKKARNYFDPESNQGNNFWNSSNPLIRRLVNTSVGVQNAPRQVMSRQLNVDRPGSIAQKVWGGKLGDIAVGTQKFVESPTSRINLGKKHEYNKYDPAYLKTLKIASNFGKGVGEAVLTEPIKTLTDYGRAVATKGVDFKPASFSVRLGQNLPQYFEGVKPFKGVKFQPGAGKMKVPLTDIKIPEFGLSESPAAETGKLALGTLEPIFTAAGISNPKALLTYAGLTGLLGGFVETVTGGDFSEGATRSLTEQASSLATSSGFLSATNVATSGIPLPYVVKLPFRQALEVLQGIGYDNITGSQTTATSILIDALSPIGIDIASVSFKKLADSIAKMDLPLFKKLVGVFKGKDAELDEKLDTIEVIIRKNNAGRDIDTATGRFVDKVTKVTRETIETIGDLREKAGLERYGNAGGFIDFGAEIGGEKPELTPQDRKFNTTFAKFIADKDVSRTTGTQRAVPLTKIRSKIAQDVIDFREGVTTKATPEVEKAVALVKKEFDQAYKDAVGAGVDVGYLKNYVPHYWKETSEVVEQTYKSAGKSFKRSKQRVLPTYKEGISLGLTPKYTHPAQMLEAYITGLEQYKASKNFLEGLKSNKTIVHTKAGRKLPGYSPISAPGLGKSQYTFPTSEGKTTVIGDWWAKDADARKISQIFGFLNEGTLAKTLGRAAEASSKLQDWVLSGGVPGTPINAFSIAQAQKEVLSGRVRSPLATTIDALVPGRTQKFFAKNAGQTKKMQSRNVQLRSSFSVDNMIDTPLRKKIFGSGISGAWTKLVNEPTFGRFMPMLQIRLFNDIEAQALKSGMGDKKAADVAAKAVSNFYGLINTAKEVTRDKALRDATTTFLFAPQYRESMVNLWVNEVKALKNPLALENRTNIKFAIGAVATFMAMDQINRAVNGQGMLDNPEGKKDKLLIPVEGGITIGVPFLSSIATIPRGAARIAGEVVRGDISGAAKEAFTTFASIGLKPLGEIALNQDHFGNEIVEEGDSPKDRIKKQLTHIFGAVNHPYARAILESYTKPDQPIYQRLSMAMELPFRFYKTESVENAPFWEEYHKLKAVQEQYDAMKRKDPAKAEQLLEEYSDEINEFNIMRGYMDQYYKETEGGGKSDILKNFEFYQKGINPNLLPEDREFEQSKDAPQGTLDKLGLYGTSFIRNPQDTIDAVIAGQPLRKMRGGASVVERQADISGIDVGKKSTQVDHHIPLWAGGQDRTDNYESLRAEDHKAKSAYEAGLRAKLEKGEMSQKQVKKAIKKWYTDNNIKPVALTPSERATPGITTPTEKADIKTARDTFDDSGKNFEVFGDVVFRRTEAGNVTTTSKLSYDYQLNTAKMSKLKKSGNMKSWMTLAEKQIDIIEEQLTDDSLDELEKIKLQNRAETLIGQMKKYSGYGGFTKGKAKKGVKVSFKKIIPAKIKTRKTTRKAPPKISIKKVPSIKVTKTKVPSLNFKTKTYDTVKIKGFRNDLG